MDGTILWLIGIALAFADVGISMYYLGKATVHPECSKEIGREIHHVSMVWMFFGAIWIIVAGVLIYATD